MPPPKKAFTKEEKKQFLDTLGSELAEHDMKKKESSGRVVLRRLSSTEYENAIKDLLHIPEIDVKKFLPGDAKYHGIENVADRQQISYNQIAQYLEAAETSLQAAVVLRPKPNLKPKRYPANKVSASRKFFPNGYKMVEDKLIVVKEPVVSQQPYQLINSPTEPGFYKIRFKANTSQLKNIAMSNKEKVTDASNLLPGKRNQTVALGVFLGRYLDMFDVTPETGIYETEVWLNGRERLSINFPDLPLRSSKFSTGKKPKFWDTVTFEWLEIQGPTIEKWPPASHQALFGQLPLEKWRSNTGLQKPRTITIGTGKNRQVRNAKGGPYHVVSKDPYQDSYDLLHNFMQRAYRRPVMPDEVKQMQSRVLKAVEDSICFQDAMLIAYKAILCSPDFLYVREEQGKLTGVELATRLSLYLWRSIPDKKLMEVALSGKLTEKSILISEANRMMRDPKFDRFIENFTEQWLKLSAIYATTPDKTLYPEYYEKNLLIESFVRETKAFVSDLIKSNLPISNIIDSDHAFLNEMLANHYNIPGIKGSHIRKVQLPKDSVRGGIITQGSIMKITANGFTTSPILRGIWLLEQVLGTPPPPAPPNAGSVEPDIRGAKTIREQLDKHRQVKSCNSCHKMIDPPGFALEQFDVMGGFRDQYRSLRNGKKKTQNVGKIRYDYREAIPVDSAGEFAGEQFTGIVGFKEILKKDTRQIARNITERLVTQATGALPGYTDRLEIERILDVTEEQGFNIKSLIGRVILTPMFLEK